MDLQEIVRKYNDCCTGCGSHNTARLNINIASRFSQRHCEDCGNYFWGRMQLNHVDETAEIYDPLPPLATVYSSDGIGFKPVRKYFEHMSDFDPWD